MRIDKVIFDGENPFSQFSTCNELTVLLSSEGFTLIGQSPAANILLTFNGSVKEFEGSDYRTSYSIPLSLIVPLFKIDDKKTNNILELTTTQTSVTVSYNEKSIDSEIFSPNGMTLTQVKEITTDGALELDTKELLLMAQMFGTSADNFLNVDKTNMFISDGFKSLIGKSLQEIDRSFSLPLTYIRALRDMECTKLFIGDYVIGQNNSGVWVVTSLTKLTDNNTLLDFRFASKLKNTEKFKVNINKYSKYLQMAVGSKVLSAKLDLRARVLTISSESGEKAAFELDTANVESLDEIDFFSDDSNKAPLVITDKRLIRTLSSNPNVVVKVTPSFLLAKLGDNHFLMFQLKDENK